VVRGTVPFWCRSGAEPGRPRGGQWAVLPAHYGFLSLLPALLVLFTGLGFVLAGSP